MLIHILKLFRKWLRFRGYIHKFKRFHGVIAANESSSAMLLTLYSVHYAIEFSSIMDTAESNLRVPNLKEKMACC